MKLISVEDQTHKKLKLISTLSEKSIKKITDELLKKSINDLLQEELAKYLEAVE